MRRTTLRTIPHSYSETFQASRPADCIAVRTGLGTKSFVSFDIHRLPSGSLVPQHRPERGPASIQNGFRHSGFCKPRRVHIADDDQTILVSQSLAGDVEEVLSPVGDLGVDRTGTFLISGALGAGETFLLCTIEAGSFYPGPVAHGGECLEAKVNTNLAIAAREVVFNLALEGDVPAATSVLNECTGLERTVDSTRLPEAESSLEVYNGVIINAHGTGDEWHPTQRPLGTKAGTKARATAMRITRCGKLAADGLNGIGVQAEFGCATGTELDQIEGGRPSDGQSHLAATLGLSLRGNAEVPDLIASDCVPVEMLPDDGILDTEFVCDDAHFGSALLPSGRIKSASSGASPSARSFFVPSQNINSKRSALLSGLKSGVSRAWII